MILYFQLILDIQILISSTLIQLYHMTRSSLSVNSFLKGYIKTLKIMISKLPFVLLINITVSLICFLILYLNEPISSLIYSVQPYGFLANYLQGLLISSVFAYIVQTTFDFAKRYYDHINVDDTDKTGS